MIKPFTQISPPIFTNVSKPYSINQDYVENRFNRKDYRRLYLIASTTHLKNYIKSADFRDKKFQRGLNGIAIKQAFYCPIDEVPLHMNPSTNDGLTDSMVEDIVRWRLDINK